MKNKEQKIVRLLEEGFSYETIKKMSNYHIDRVYKSLVNEMVVRVPAEKLKNLKDVENDLPDDATIEVTEDDDLDNSVERKSGYDPYAGNSIGNNDGPSSNDGDNNSPDGMSIDEEFFGDINEDEVLEALFGKPKMKTPITTLGMFEEINEGTRCWKGYEKKGMKTMFGKRVPNCVKKESKEEKVRQIEESILSLINKSQGKMFTKKDILEQGPSIAPVKPTVKPGVRPERGTPYKPKHSPKPKAGTEVKPARPTVKPGVKPERGTPYKPKHSPKPKAGEEQGLPEFLKFNNLNIKFRDE